MLPSVKTGLVIFFLQLSFVSFCQVKPAPATDTVTEFEIIRGPSMRSIYIDSSTTLQTIAGGGEVKQGTTLFFADSIVVNPTLHTAEAFNNVHINQADTVQTYADHLIYYGKEKNAILHGNVRLYDNKATLFTEDLDYNLGTGIGNYHNGGKVINGKTTITSTDGTYFSDTKDVYFKNNVVVNQPKNHTTTDSLMYNMETQNYSVIGQTYIQNNETRIYTSAGNYDYTSDYTLFTTRTKVIDSSGRVYIANNMAIDNKSGNAQMEGNGLVRDSAGGYTAFADQIFLNKKSNSFLATRKPVLIIKQDNDSIYVAADTIFSGFSTAVSKTQFTLTPDTVANDSVQLRRGKDSLAMRDTSGNMQKLQAPLKKDSLLNDSLRQRMEKEFIRRPDTSHHIEKRLLGIEPGVLRSDSLKQMNEKAMSMHADTVHHFEKEVMPVKNDSLKQARGDTLHFHRADTALLNKEHIKNAVDSIMSEKKDSSVSFLDTAGITVKAKRSLDSLEKSPAADTVSKPDSVRYFIAFHHVRIYNDSLQSVCDSLFFSAKDSVFRLYYQPVVWNGRSQITGDTMFLYTKNKKADRLYVFDSGFIVNQTPEGFFNQIAGKTINGYFKGGKIDYMRVRGSQAESIYYAQDADSAYLGMNRATGDVIDLYFDSSDLKKVLFINQINGTFYPMRKIPEDQKYLRNFIWLDKERPKNKLELFE